MSYNMQTFVKISIVPFFIVEIFGLPSKESVLGLNIFENPMINDEIREKLISREPVSFHMDYSFNTIEDKGFYPTMKNGTIDIFS